MNNHLGTNSIDFQALLGNGKSYKVPFFQRDYSWGKEQWEDLWDDIVIIDETSTPHYMGTIVLKTTEENKVFEIIDGQQRLTTLSLLVLAITKLLSDFSDGKEKNIERINKIKQTYLGEKSLVDLAYKSKLSLNKNNRIFYKTKILPLKELDNPNTLSESNRKLYNAYLYFYDKLKNKFTDGDKIGAFLENIISNKLIFIQITANNDLNAYNVFETLNARGVDLTATDLLKNYLFSIVAQNKTDNIETLEEEWKKIINNIGAKNFPTFLRYYLNSKSSPIIRKNRLFKSIKEKVKSVEEVLVLIEELEKYSYLYEALKNPTSDFWKENPKKNDIEKSLNELALFRAEQQTPLLFSVYMNCPDYFSAVLKKCVVISFRHNVIGKKNPNELERVYNKLASLIQNAKEFPKEDFDLKLNSIYLSDSEFKNAFELIKISTKRNKKLVKYILTKLEKQISNNTYDANDSSFTIEHILPENYTKDWKDIFENNIEDAIYRLGNYTLLEDKKNKNCGTKSFDEKNIIYKTSKCALSNEFCNYDTWDSSAINIRQKKLADVAKTVWKI